MSLVSLAGIMTACCIPLSSPGRWWAWSPWLGSWQPAVYPCPHLVGDELGLLGWDHDSLLDGILFNVSLLPKTINKKTKTNRRKTAAAEPFHNLLLSFPIFVFQKNFKIKKEGFQVVSKTWKKFTRKGPVGSGSKCFDKSDPLIYLVKKKSSSTCWQHLSTKVPVLKLNF